MILGHHSHQLIILKENFDISILIIEGDENIYEIRNFHPNSIRGMLASIALDFQIPIIHTRNFRDTASLLAVIAKRMEKTKKLPSLLTKRKPITIKELQIYIIESLPGIGPTLAKALLKKNKRFKVECSRSLCFMQPHTGWHLKDFYATKAWNTRIPPAI